MAPQAAHNYDDDFDENEHGQSSEGSDGKSGEDLVRSVQYSDKEGNPMDVQIRPGSDGNVEFELPEGKTEDDLNPESQHQLGHLKDTPAQLLFPQLRGKQPSDRNLNHSGEKADGGGDKLDDPTGGDDGSGKPPDTSLDDLDQEDDDDDHPETEGPKVKMPPQDPRRVENKAAPARAPEGQKDPREEDDDQNAPHDPRARGAQTEEKKGKKGKKDKKKKKKPRTPEEIKKRDKQLKKRKRAVKYGKKAGSKIAHSKAFGKTRAGKALHNKSYNIRGKNRKLYNHAHHAKSKKVTSKAGLIATGTTLGTKGLEKAGLLSKKQSFMLVCTINIIALAIEFINIPDIIGAIFFVINLAFFLLYLYNHRAQIKRIAKNPIKSLFALGMAYMTCCSACIVGVLSFFMLIIVVPVLLFSGLLGGGSDAGSTNTVATPSSERSQSQSGNDVFDLNELSNNQETGYGSVERGENGYSQANSYSNDFGSADSGSGVRNAVKNCPALKAPDMTYIARHSSMTSSMVFQPVVTEALNAASEEVYNATGRPLVISSGTRSSAQQAGLRSGSGGGPVGSAGGSWHNSGYAFDIPYSEYGPDSAAGNQKVQEIMKKYGFDILMESTRHCTHFQYRGGSTWKKYEYRGGQYRVIDSGPRGESLAPNPYSGPSDAYRNQCVRA